MKSKNVAIIFNYFFGLKAMSAVFNQNIPLIEIENYFSWYYCNRI